MAMRIIDLFSIQKIWGVESVGLWGGSFFGQRSIKRWDSAVSLRVCRCVMDECTRKFGIDKRCARPCINTHSECHRRISPQVKFPAKRSYL
jgi:hypothetical protein